MKSTPSRFKRLIIDGVEISVEKIEKYSELEQVAYDMFMQVDPETLTIVPIQEQTKQWENGDRQPSDFQGRE